MKAYTAYLHNRHRRVVRELKKAAEARFGGKPIRWAEEDGYRLIGGRYYEGKHYQVIIALNPPYSYKVFERVEVVPVGDHARYA